jgi:hypothetical protein
MSVWICATISEASGVGQLQATNSHTATSVEGGLLESPTKMCCFQKQQLKPGKSNVCDTIV